MLDELISGHCTLRVGSSSPVPLTRHMAGVWQVSFDVLEDLPLLSCHFEARVAARLLLGRARGSSAIQKQWHWSVPRSLDAWCFVGQAQWTIICIRS